MRLLTVTFILIAAGFFLMTAGLLRGDELGTWEFMIGGGLSSLGALGAAALAGKTVRKMMKDDERKKDQ